MATDKRSCPDCGGDMTLGFILDMTYGGQLVPRWVKGSPEKSMWTVIKAKGKECRSVDTYRCVKCGLLKSYATTEVDPPGLWGN